MFIFTTDQHQLIFSFQRFSHQIYFSYFLLKSILLFETAPWKHPAIHSSIKEMRTVTNRPISLFWTQIIHQRVAITWGVFSQGEWLNLGKNSEFYGILTCPFPSIFPQRSAALETINPGMKQALKTSALGRLEDAEWLQALENSIARELLPFSRYLMSSQEKVRSVRRV